MTGQIYMIVVPRQLSIICNGSDLICYVDQKEVEKTHGKYHLQRNGIRPHHCFGFVDGIQAEAVKPIDDELRMSGKAFMQLMIFHGWRNGNAFTTDDFKRFFEGNALNAVHSYFFDVVVPILKATAPDSIDGADTRWAVGQELTRNADFWRAVGAPVADIIETLKRRTESARQS